MTERKTEPLAPSDAALLGLLRGPEDVPEDVQRALFARVTATLAGGVPPGGGGAPGGASGARGPSTGARARPSPSVPWMARPWSTGLLGFALGGLVGAAAHAGLSTRAPVPTADRGIARLAEHAAAPALPAVGAPDEPERPAEAAALARPADPRPASPSPAGAQAQPLARASPTSTPPHVDAPPDVTGAPEASGSASPDAALARERALVQMARTALTQGQSDRALAALERHAAESPDGRLREDRDALQIQALARSGHASEARAALDRFRKRFPSSVFLPAAEQAVAAAAGRP